MQKGFALIFIMIGVMILTGALVGGYYLYQQQKIKSINSFEECAKAGYPVMQIYPPRCNTPDGRSFTKELSEAEKKKLQPPNETADWKTYINTEFGFSFTYPEEGFEYLLEDKSKVGVSLHLSPTKDILQSDKWLSVYADNLSNHQNPKITVEEWINLEGNQRPRPVRKGLVLIGGVKGEKIAVDLIELYPKNWGMELSFYYKAIVIHKGFLYTISLGAYQPEVLKKNEVLFDQVVKSFKFL